MSHNQSRGEKYEGHVRKAGRSGSSGYHRGFSGGAGGGKVGAGYGGPPAPSSTSSHEPSQNPSLSASRSFRKTGGGNGQGGQVRMPPAGISSEGGGAASLMMYRPVQNGTHTQAPSPGNPNVPLNCSSQITDASSSKVPRDLPKPPQLSKGGSDSMSPATPMKGETPGAVVLQFGSINPGVVNGIQIPARTSSAPPNLDEQKHDQVARESFVPIPSREQPPTQPPQKKEIHDSSQPSTGPSQFPSAAKREVSFQIPASAPMSAPKQSIPMSGMSRPFFQHPQAPVQFGGHNSQIHSQSIAPGPLSMSMVPIPLGPGHPMIVAGLQSHAVHQGQGLNFAGPMNHQISPQIGNMSMGISAQYGQPHGNFGAPRKSAVKITHPETHEELKLGKTAGSYVDSSGQRSHGSMPGKSQQIPTFSHPHPTSYLQSNPYAPTSVYSAPSSAPSIGTQTTRPQVQQYNFPFGQSGNPVSIANPPARPSAMITKSETLVQSTPEQPNLDDGQTIPVLSTVPTTDASIKNISLGKDVTKHIDKHEEYAATNTQKINTTVSDSAVDQNKSITEGPGNIISVKGSIAPPQKTESGSCLSTSVTSALDSGDTSSNTVSQKMEHTQRVDSIKVNHKKASKEDNQVMRQVHKVLVSEGTSKIDSQLSCPVEDHDASSEARLQVPPESAPSDLQEGLAVPVLLASPSDSGNQETMEDVSDLKSTPSTITTDDLVQRGREHSSSVATDVHINLYVGSNEEASVLKHEGVTQLDVELEHDSNELKESDKASASDACTTGIDNAKICPVSCAIESSMDGHKINNSPESTTIEENVAICKSNNVNLEHISAKEEKTSLPSAFPGPCVSEGGEAITKDAGVAVADSGDTVPASVSSSPSISKEQQLPEIPLARTGAGKKKKKKELLSKADAAGTNSDLYMAYKGPDEKPEAKTTSESTDGSAVNVNRMSEGGSIKLVGAMEKEGQSKVEIDDWEDVADISTPNLKMSNSLWRHHGSQKLESELKSGSMTKRYTRDFLLTFSKHCTGLPADFEIGPDLEKTLMSIQGDLSFSSHARTIDQSSGPSRIDHHAMNALDDNRWTKTNSFPSVRVDGHVSVNSFRQGSNNVILRGRGAILPRPGPLQPGTHGLISRNNIESDRWQRASGSQRGLVPSPHMPAQIMHKAEKKYEVGKVSDDEEAKQRQIKAILNKLTPQNFDRLFEKVKEVGIDSAETLTGVISQIFDKALMEPTFCEMYADFCFHLSGTLPGFSEKDEKITFKRLLLNKCQEEFERGEREEAEAGKVEGEGEMMQTPQEREEKRLKARRRMLGNIRLIGELYKKRMLTERIMHECIKKLLGQQQKPDEEDIEALCKLMSTIGEMIDHSKAKEHMDAYFDMMKKLSTNQTLSSRVRFMLKDAIDLRKNNWQQRRKVEGPKKIEEVHRDAAQERVQTSRSVRGSGIVSSSRRGPASDYGQRSSAQSSQQFRTFPTLARGFGTQDVRMEDRHPTESRMSMPLPQRMTTHDDTITLGPQGGLARDMSLRGQPMVQNAPLADYTRESRRTGSGPNGKSSASTWASNSSKEEVMARTSSDRFSSAPYDYSTSHERIPNLSNGDLRKADVLDRSIPSICPHDHLTSSVGNVSETMSDERLREKSITTIREYYSANDVKEVALCVEELNSPGFYPSMVSLWVTDSFERKDAERDLLAKLLITLSKSEHRILSQAQLIKGFEEVLLNLEEAVNDAPRAAEFLGRIVAKIILEDMISFNVVGRLIREGGEEPGCLVESGLASDVLGSILEIIKSEGGDAVLDQMKSGFSLRLEDFRPPHPTKSRKLDAFL